jgi:cystathionine beta-synthase
MKRFNISQIPVIDSTGFVGSLDENVLFRAYVNDHAVADKPVKDFMGACYPVVSYNTKAEQVASLFQDHQAVLVALENGKHHIITKYDVIATLA